jgi:hypothetical protein
MMLKHVHGDLSLGMSSCTVGEWGNTHDCARRAEVQSGFNHSIRRR